MKILGRFRKKRIAEAIHVEDVEMLPDYDDIPLAEPINVSIPADNDDNRYKKKNKKKKKRKRVLFSNTSDESYYSNRNSIDLGEAIFVVTIIVLVGGLIILCII